MGKNMVVKKIFITGASGYIGKELARYFLKRGYELNLLTRDKMRIPLDLLESKKVNIFVGSLENRNVLREAVEGVGAIFHLAACLSTFETRNNLLKTNELGLKNILLECKKTNRAVRFVFASSVDVEKRRSDYAESKLRGEEIIKKIFLSNTKISYTIIRIGNVYQKGESGMVKGIEEIINRNNWQSSVLYYLLGDKHLYLVEMKNLIKKMAEMIDDSNAVNKTVLAVDKRLTIREIFKQKKVKSLPKYYFGLSVLLKIWLILGKIFKKADLLVYLSLEE